MPEAIVLAPRRALRRDDKESYVWVVEDRRVRRRPGTIAAPSERH